MRRTFVLFLLAALASACGGRAPIDGADAGTNTNNNGTTNNNTGTPDSGVAWNGMPSRNILVRYVLDGDTIIVSANETVRTPDGEPMDGTKIRLIGVNAPEIAHEGSSAECWGDEAAAFTTEAIEGRIVTLDYDTTHCQPPNQVVGCRDVYGRLLAYVILSEEVINESLLRTGNARVFRGERFEHRDSARYNDLEAVARAQDLGMWSCP